MIESVNKILDDGFHAIIDKQLQDNSLATTTLAAVDFDYLLHFSFYQHRYQEDRVHQLFLSLAYSDINDHLEGGFFTQTAGSTSMQALQKPLNSNAEWIDLLTHASGHFFDGVLSVPAINSTQWLTTNLQHPSGAFYQSMGGDNNSTDYYRIDQALLDSHLDNDAYRAFASTFGINEHTDFPIYKLRRIRSYLQVSEDASMHLKQVPLALDAAKQLLAIARNNHQRPTINTNIDCKANSKAIAALINAARQFNRDHFAEAGFAAIDCLRQQLWSDKQLRISSDNPSAADTASYLLLIHALIKRLQYRWSDKDFQWLTELAEQLPATGEDLFKALSEAATDSVIADLNILYLLTSEHKYLSLADSIETKIMQSLEHNPETQPALLLALLKKQFSQMIIVIRGSNYESAYWLQQLATGFKPDKQFFAIPNDCTDPCPDKFPASPETRAVSYALDNSTQCYQSLDSVLKDHP